MYRAKKTRSMQELAALLKRSGISLERGFTVLLSSTTVCPCTFDRAFEQVLIEPNILGQESKHIYTFSDLLFFLCSSKPCLLSDTLKETGDT